MKPVSLGISLSSEFRTDVTECPNLRVLVLRDYEPTPTAERDFVPTDGTKAANCRKRRLRYVAVFLGSSQASNALDPLRRSA